MQNNLGNLGTAFVEVRADLDELNKGLRNARTVSRDSSRKISKDFEGIGKGAAKATASIKAIGTAIGGLALVAAAKNALQFAEDIGDMGARANVSTGFLQELQFAAQKFGAEASNVNEGLTQLNTRLGIFVSTGGGPAKAAFDRLGISAQITSGEISGTEDVFKAIIRQMELIVDPAERASLAGQALGEEAGRKLAVLLGQGEVAIDGYAEQARRLGIVLDEGAVAKAAEANRALRELSMVVSNNFTNALIQAAPQIEQISELLAETLPVLLDWVGAFARFLAPDQGTELEQRLKGINEQIRQLSNSGSNLLGPSFSTQERIRELRAEAELLGDLIADEIGSQVDPAKVVEPIRKAIELGTRQRPVDVTIKPVADTISGGFGNDDLTSGSVSDQIEQATISLGGFEDAAGDAFAEFALGTGRAKDVFRGFAQSIIADIGRIIARQLVLNAIGAIFPGFGGFGSIGGAIAGSLGFGGARAEGGPVQTGRAFLVGERGPELFVPGANGNIVANEMMNGAGGGNSVVNNFNINGMLTQDVEMLRTVVEQQTRNFSDNVLTVVNQGQRTGGIR